MKRTQIYVDEEQDRRLAERAGQLGVTKSELIRTAVDRMLEADDADRRLEDFRDALTSTAGTAPSLPDGSALVEDLRRLDAARLHRLSGP